MKILFENFPETLETQNRTISECLKAFCGVKKIHQVYLFGSFARGEEKSDSDVDLCIVADDSEKQLESAALFRKAIRHIKPKPAFSLLPITPGRLKEKRKAKDHFFATILKEGILIADED